MDLGHKILAKSLVGVFVFNLVFMRGGAWYPYQNTPPIPDRVVGPNGGSGRIERPDTNWKAVFQSDGLINQATVLENDTYFGMD